MSVCGGCETQSGEERDLTDVDNWFKFQIQQNFLEIRHVEEGDAPILAAIVKMASPKIPIDRYIRIRSELRRTANIIRILQFAQKHASNCKFVMEFAFCLYDSILDNSIDLDQANYLLARTLVVAVPYLCTRGPDNWSLQPWNPSPALTAAHDQYTQHADRMVRLLHCCIVAGLQHEEHLLLRHYDIDAHIADTAILQYVFFPYLKRLLKLMRDYNIAQTEPAYQWQFQQVISKFITYFVGVKPPDEPVDLTSSRHDIWRERAIKANELMQDICGDDEWRLLLGDGYGEYMELKAVMRA